MADDGEWDPRKAGRDPRIRPSSAFRWLRRSSDANLLFGRDHKASRPLFDLLRLEHCRYALEQCVAAGSRQAHKKETGVSAGCVAAHIRKIEILCD